MGGRAPPAGSSAQEGRALGFWLCLALVVGNFIGSGIFLLPSQLAPYGWNAVFGWVATIGGGLCLAFVFARLARALPLAAGPYAYVQEAFGPLAAFAVAWSYWIALWVGNTAIATAAISYMSLFVPALAEQPGLGALVTAALLWTLTAINCASVRAGGFVQAVTAILKLIPLIVVIVVAALVMLEGRQEASLPLRTQDLSLASINGAAALTLWAMLGVECAAVASRRVVEPAHNVPRATLIGTLFVGVVYLLVSTPIVLFLPAEDVAASNAPIALFVSTYWTAGLGLAVGVFAAISATGTLNGFVLLQGEIPLAMARNGAFPSWFAKTSRNGIPVRAQIVSSLLATALIAANSSRSVAGLFVFMALLATAATLVLYLACALAALRLQGRGPLQRSTALTLVASLAALYAVWTLYGAGYEATGWGAVLLATGIPVYLIMRRARSTPAEAAIPAAPAG